MPLIIMFHLAVPSLAWLSTPFVFLVEGFDLLHMVGTVTFAIGCKYDRSILLLYPSLFSLQLGEVGLFIFMIYHWYFGLFILSILGYQRLQEMPRTPRKLGNEALLRQITIWLKALAETTTKVYVVNVLKGLKKRLPRVHNAIESIYRRNAGNWNYAALKDLIERHGIKKVRTDKEKQDLEFITRELETPFQPSGLRKLATDKVTELIQKARNYTENEANSLLERLRNESCLRHVFKATPVGRKVYVEAYHRRKECKDWATVEDDETEQTEIKINPYAISTIQTASDKLSNRIEFLKKDRELIRQLEELGIPKRGVGTLTKPCHVRTDPTIYSGAQTTKTLSERLELLRETTGTRKPFRVVERFVDSEANTSSMDRLIANKQGRSKHYVWTTPQRKLSDEFMNYMACIGMFICLIFAVCGVKQDERLHIHPIGMNIKQRKKRHRFSWLRLYMPENERVSLNEGDIYAISSKFFLGYYKIIGHGFYWRGGFYTCEHVINNRQLCMNNTEMVQAFSDPHSDIAVYGKPRGDFPFPSTVTVDTYKCAIDGDYELVEADVLEDNCLEMGKVEPGSSGLPIVEVTSTGPVPIGMIMSEGVNPKYTVMTSTSNTPDTTVVAGGTRVQWVIAHCGSGKTRTRIPDYVRAQQRDHPQNSQVYIAGPTRVVAHEITEGLIGQGFIVHRGYRGSGETTTVRSNINVFCHETLLKKLINEKTLGGLFVVDEAHFQNAATIALQKLLLSRSAKSPAFKTVFLTATGPYSKDETTNCPVERMIGGERDGMEWLRTHKDEKAIWFVRSAARATIVKDKIHDMDGMADYQVVMVSRMDPKFKEARDLETGLIITTEISECGANFNPDFCYDEGEKCVPIWDGDQNVVTMHTETITQASMIQRRGRVGRRRRGTYMSPGINTQWKMYYPHATYWYTARIMLGDDKIWTRYKLCEEPEMDDFTNDMLIERPTEQIFEDRFWDYVYHNLAGAEGRKEMRELRKLRSESVLSDFIAYAFGLNKTANGHNVPLYDDKHASDFEGSDSQFLHMFSPTGGGKKIRLDFSLLDAYAIFALMMTAMSMVFYLVLKKTPHEFRTYCEIFKGLSPVIAICLFTEVDYTPIINKSFTHLIIFWLLLSTIVANWMPDVVLSYSKQNVFALVTCGVHILACAWPGYKMSILALVEVTVTLGYIIPHEIIGPGVLIGTLADILGETYYIISLKIANKQTPTLHAITTLHRLTCLLIAAKTIYSLGTAHLFATIFGISFAGLLGTIMYADTGIQLTINVFMGTAMDYTGLKNIGANQRAMLHMIVTFTYFVFAACSGYNTCWIPVFAIIAIQLLGRYFDRPEVRGHEVFLGVLCTFNGDLMSSVALFISTYFPGLFRGAQLATDTSNNWYTWKQKLNQMDKAAYERYKNSDVPAFSNQYKAQYQSRSYFKIRGVKLNNRGRTLEIGTGRGGWTLYLVEQGHKDITTYTLKGEDRVGPSDEFRLRKDIARCVKFRFGDGFRDRGTDYATIVCDVGESHPTFYGQTAYARAIRRQYEKVLNDSPRAAVYLKEMAPWDSEARDFAQRYGLKLIRSEVSRNSAGEMYYVKGQFESTEDIAIMLLNRMNVKLKPRPQIIPEVKREILETEKYIPPTKHLMKLEEIDYSESLRRVECAYRGFKFKNETEFASMEEIAVIPNAGDVTSSVLYNRILKKATRQLVKHDTVASAYSLTDTSIRGVFEVFKRKVDTPPQEYNPYRDKEDEVEQILIKRLKGNYRMLTTQEAIDGIPARAAGGLGIADWKNDPDLIKNVHEEMDAIYYGRPTRGVVNTMGKREKKFMKDGSRVGSRQIAYYDIHVRIIERIVFGDLIDSLTHRSNIQEGVGGMNPTDFFEMYARELREGEKHEDDSWYIAEDVAGWDTRVSRIDLERECHLLMALVEDGYHKRMILMLYSMYADHLLAIKKIMDTGEKKVSIVREQKGRMSGVIITYTMNTLTNIIKRRVQLMIAFNLTALQVDQELCNKRWVSMVCGDDAVIGGTKTDMTQLGKHGQYWETIGYNRKDMKPYSESEIIKDYNQVSFCSHNPAKITIHTKNGPIERYVSDRPEGEILGKLALSVGAFSTYENEIAHALSVRNSLCQYAHKRDIRLLINVLTELLPNNILPAPKQGKVYACNFPWLAWSDIESIVDAVYNSASQFYVGHKITLNDIEFLPQDEDIKRGSHIHLEHRAHWKRSLTFMARNFRNEYPNYTYNDLGDRLRQVTPLDPSIIIQKRSKKAISEQLFNKKHITLVTERNNENEKARVIPNHIRIYVGNHPSHSLFSEEWNKAIRNNCEYLISLSYKEYFHLKYTIGLKVLIPSQFNRRNRTEVLYLYHTFSDRNS
nr:TPA_asm: hypothetical protein [Candiflavili virus]